MNLDILMALHRILAVLEKIEAKLPAKPAISVGG